jgi:hypothetical protein
LSRWRRSHEKAKNIKGGKAELALPRGIEPLFSLERMMAAYALAVGMSSPKHLIMQL